MTQRFIKHIDWSNARFIISFLMLIGMIGICHRVSAQPKELEVIVLTKELQDLFRQNVGIDYSEPELDSLYGSLSELMRLTAVNTDSTTKFNAYCIIDSILVYAYNHYELGILYRDSAAQVAKNWQERAKLLVTKGVIQEHTNRIYESLNTFFQLEKEGLLMDDQLIVLRARAHIQFIRATSFEELEQEGDYEKIQMEMRDTLLIQGNIYEYLNVSLQLADYYTKRLDKRAQILSEIEFFAMSDKLELYRSVIECNTIDLTQGAPACIPCYQDLISRYQAKLDAADYWNGRLLQSALKTMLIRLLSVANPLSDTLNYKSIIQRVERLEKQYPQGQRKIEFIAAKAEYLSTIGESEAAYREYVNAVELQAIRSSSLIRAEASIENHEVEMEDLLKLREELTLRTEKNASLLISQKLMFVVGGVLASFAVFVFFSARKKRRQLGEQKQEAIKQNMLLEQINNANQKNMVLLNHELEYEVKETRVLERELFLMTIKLESSRRLLKKIASVCETVKNDQRRFLSREIKLAFAMIKLRAKDSIWHELLISQVEISGEFKERLLRAHPDLTVSEINHCTYVIHGMQTRKVAELLGVSTRTVENSRYRIRKKMDLPSDIRLEKALTGI